jgi:hypothetical protein
MPLPRLSTVKDAFTIARELVLLGLFFFLLVLPTKLNSRLSDAGLASVNGGFFTWKAAAAAAVDQSKVAAQANSAASDSLDEVKKALTEIADKSTDKNAKAQATTALQQINGSISSLNTANQSIANSLVTLQTANTAQSSASSGSSMTQGWVYLGEVDAAKQRWIIPPTPKVDAGSAIPAKGQIIVLTDDLYLRGDKGPGQTFNQASILGAVHSGASATVLDVQFSSAINGGKFVWAKISTNTGK